MTQLAIADYVSNDHIINEVAIDDREGRLATRAKIENFEVAFQNAMGSETGEMEEINDNGLNEYFIGGAYTRSLLIPKGTAIVSKLWSKPRLWIIATGEVTIVSELGKQRVKAPYVAEAPFGSKITLYAHEDTLWFAVTGAESTNSKEVEEEMTVTDYSNINYPWDMLGEDK